MVGGWHGSVLRFKFDGKRRLLAHELAIIRTARLRPSPL